jgi:TPR repeat protein
MTYISQPLLRGVNAMIYFLGWCYGFTAKGVENQEKIKRAESWKLKAERKGYQKAMNSEKQVQDWKTGCSFLDFRPSANTR